MTPPETARTRMVPAPLDFWFPEFFRVRRAILQLAGIAARLVLAIFPGKLT